ncbi:outer membrane protein assembly factor BamD [Paenochrobactrum gallinarii]|uniref:Outer membrane protein assembly factor BamD n=1 Tax=Paenochrobactrum gallinarii TaxID=643673 RepID=A0A841LSE1_9HYPH|nr:outer membrane protein assembly factor BamD [Paenochrobactrum gallinarii]MBB6259820.1 outer membrane protein assembly factor BamD [Paenochrobactrum gallinarii]
MTSFKFPVNRATAMLVGTVAVVAILSGCASKDDAIDLSKYVETIDAPDKLYNEALANLDGGRLGEAAKKFAAIDRQHPYTEWARKSLVMGAFTNYRQGNYEEAISMSKRYNTLYPTSPESAYAYYIIGLSYFRQIPDVTRDQAASKRAIAAMQEVIDRYPDSEYVEDAKTKIRFARDQLAGKEMQVGRYYLEGKDYLAAVKRFRGVVEEYSNTRHVEEALARLVEAYYALGLTSEAQMAASVLGQNYPDSQWYKDSYKLLQSGGLEPRNNTGSWLSKAGALITGGGA